MLTLAIGDLYIPDRSIDIPAKFRKLLAPTPFSTPSNSKIAQVLCLGNVTNSFDTLQFLHNVSPSFHLVRGEFDDTTVLSQQLAQIDGADVKDVKEVPNYKIITVDGLRIGFTNGYQIVPKNDALSLSALAREWDVDVLVWGGSHKVEAYILDGKFFINPGSGTGAFSFDWPEESDEEEEGEEGDDIGETEEVEEPEEVEPEKESEKESEEVEPVESEKVEEDHGDEKEKEGIEDVVDEDSKTGEKEVQGSEEAEIAPEEAKEETEEEETKDEPTEESTEEYTEGTKEHTEDSKETDSKTTIETPELSQSEVFAAETFPTTIPSFCLLETHSSSCTLYIYTYLDDEVKVDKVIYHKDH